MDQKDTYKYEEHHTPLQEPVIEVYDKINPEVIDNSFSERIPGLAYTHAERIAAVRETMAEIRAGVTGVDSEEVYDRLQELYNRDPE